MLLQVLLQVASQVASQAVNSQISKPGNVNFTVPSDMTIFLVGVVCSIAFLLVAILVANLIKFEPGSNPRDPHKRRAWFWILGALSLITCFVLLYFWLMPIDPSSIKGLTTTLLNQYNAKFMHFSKMCPISCAVSFVLYVFLGFVLSKIFKNKKIGNWF